MMKLEPWQLLAIELCRTLIQLTTNPAGKAVKISHLPELNFSAVENLVLVRLSYQIAIRLNQPFPPALSSLTSVV